MIRDPQFNSLFEAQLPPWGVTTFSLRGYTIPLSAVRETIPSEVKTGSLSPAGTPSPEALLEFYASNPALILLNGTWTTQHSLLIQQSTPPLTPSSEDDETVLVSPYEHFPHFRGLHSVKEEDEVQHLDEDGDEGMEW